MIYVRGKIYFGYLMYRRYAYDLCALKHSKEKKKLGFCFK